jgi:hypothetical protein
MPYYSQQEKRVRPRVRISGQIRVRPSSPMIAPFDESLRTENSSRNGCYFITSDARMKKSMRLDVSFPYSTEFGAINREYVAEVMRVDELSEAKKGIAVKFIAPISLRTIQQRPRSDGRGRKKLWQADSASSSAGS